MDEKEFRAAAAKTPNVLGNGHWSRNQRALKDHISLDNCSEMLRWSTIIATMQVGSQGYVELEADYLFLSQGEEEARRWSKAVADPGFGGAEPLAYANKYTDLSLSANLIHQAYFVKRWEEHSGKEIGNLNFIMEYGGGYGAMAYVCRKLGFEGVYIIYDLPIVSLMQEYYLSNVGIHDVWFTSEPHTSETDLFISLWGVTEVSAFDRAWVADAMSAKHNLIAYATAWVDYDNVAWIRSNFKGTVTQLQHISPVLYVLVS